MGECKEGYVTTYFHPDSAELVTVIFKKIDLEWTEEGLEGVIPDVIVGCVKDTDEPLYFTPEASKKIGAWRQREMKSRNPELYAQYLRMKARSKDLRKHVIKLEKGEAL